MSRAKPEGGFTLVELVVSMTVILVISLGLFTLFTALVNSTVVAKQRAVASSLATNQMEYLKSLPYDSLAVSGGSIIANSYLPATTTKKVNNTTYTVKTSISYADDAYDGCGSYPNAQLKQTYCRNYPPPSGAPSVDANPADYKLAHVVVTNPGGSHLAAVDTQIAARVSETASTTGALFVQVTDPSGAPISDAVITVTNSTTSPVVNAADNTDSNGMAIFYGLPPDGSPDYVIAAQKTGYSSLTSIASSGSLQATYANQAVLAQQASYLSMALGAMRTKSLIVETTTTSGAVLANVKVNIKGGYKKYTSSTDRSYYFDAMTPTDTRPTTDASGITTLSNLPPINSYIFCGNNGDQGCTVGATTYYLAAAVPYGGDNSLSPITVPQANSSQSTFTYGSDEYGQKVRLLLTASSAFPRVFSVDPSMVNISDSLQAVSIVVKGYNLTGAIMTLTQGAASFSGSACTTSATQLTCTYNLSAAVSGDMQITVQNASGSLVLPVSPLGGIRVKP